MITYLLIFISKIFENTLSTLRLIIVASGKKIFGAILQLCISLMWVSVTGIVVQNLNQDPLKMIVFAIGSLAGSYFGSYLEEKLAIGNNLISYMTDDKHKIFTNLLNDKNVPFVKVKSDNKEDIFLITTPRRKKNHILKLIKEYDEKAIIISEIININYPDK